MDREGALVPAETAASLKKKTAVSRSWILLDHNGQSTILDVDKYAIMRRVQIHARDLRILDPLLSYPSTILGRERAIVLNLEHIKAIITAEEVLLRDPLDDNVIPIVEELQRRLPLVYSTSQVQGEDDENPGAGKDVETGEENENEFPFEFRALEVALEAICSYLDARTRELETDAYPALDELTSKISSLNLDRVRKLKSSMTRLTNRVQKVRDELEQLLDDDDDMADLYLSRKLVSSSSPVSSSGAPNWFLSSPTIGSKISRTSRASVTTVDQEEHDVEELEMLLEAYFMQIDSTLNKLTTLREYIDDTEDYINIQLDNHRNQLIQLELFLCSGTVCLSVYSLVAAIFGMNLQYTWREGHGYMFKWVEQMVISSGTERACSPGTHVISISPLPPPLVTLEDFDNLKDNIQLSFTAHDSEQMIFLVQHMASCVNHLAEGMEPYIEEKEEENESNRKKLKKLKKKLNKAKNRV